MRISVVTLLLLALTYLAISVIADDANAQHVDVNNASTQTATSRERLKRMGMQNIITNNNNNTLTTTTTTTATIKHMDAAGNAPGATGATSSKLSEAFTIPAFTVKDDPSLFPGELWPTTTNGAGLVGANPQGANLFMLHSEFAAVTRIDIWYCDPGTVFPFIATLEVYFDDGTSQLAGYAGKPCTLQTFNIGPDELLQNQGYITGNGQGQFVNSFGLDTNKQQIRFGVPHDKYWFNVDQARLLGFVGYNLYGSNPGVYALGFLVSKPISSAVLNDVVYDPDFFKTSPGMPTQLVRTVFCNNANAQQTRVQSWNHAKGISQCFAQSSTWNVGATVTVGGAVKTPKVIISGSASGHWGEAVSSTSDLCIQSTETESVSTNFQIPAKNSCNITILQWQAPISNLKYTGNLDLTYKDGTTVQRPVQGVYTGLDISQDQIYINCVDLPKDYTCPINTIPGKGEVPLPIKANPCTVDWDLVEIDIANRCGQAGFDTITPIMAQNFCAQYAGEPQGTYSGVCPDVNTGDILQVSGQAIQAEGGQPGGYNAINVVIE